VKGVTITKERLPEIFAQPVILLDRGYVVSLEGEKTRHFKIEQITLNTGKNDE